ncbi:MAG: hypothetical protein BWK76_10855 [Desulfobulbaceae bacterium A2]|nr:MAG: hypothetical protein BWK76_10855 [Desulfobulbaceae bacterium A2]
MHEPRVPLYNRLPEIYRIRDAEQTPPGQLRQFLALIEEAFGAIHANIEDLYHDLFIETCDDWVISYLGDLLGVSHLSGDPWTLRADVADTIALRRRKGTIAAIERLVFNLTQWGVHCVELRENMVWSQHLNHQRPDEGGMPPYSLPAVTRCTPLRGGTVPLRDPAMLSLLSTPFDPLAHIADVRPPVAGALRHNLPNLAVFLWRLRVFRLPLVRPMPRGMEDRGTVPAGEASLLLCFEVDPLGRPQVLHNTFQFQPDRQPPIVTELDRTPGAIPTARLTQDSVAGQPGKYLAIDTYDSDAPNALARDIADVGLQLHLPRSHFAGEDWPAGGSWTIRGARLPCWEETLAPPLRRRELVIDPERGRLFIGVDTPAEAEALQRHLLVSYTLAAVGPVGAQPVSRPALPEPWLGRGVLSVNLHQDPTLDLNQALREGLRRMREESSAPCIEIHDSLTHTLDPAALLPEDTMAEDGGLNLLLSRPLCIRAAANARPIIRLCRPLRFRPRQVDRAGDIVVRLEGLFLTGDGLLTAEEPLIARAAINRLEIIGCTLDPGGHRFLDGADERRAPITDALVLRTPYGFEDFHEDNAFAQTPELIVQRSITGPLRIDAGYRLVLSDTLIDAGPGSSAFQAAPYHRPDSQRFALSAAGDAEHGWGPVTRIDGLTVFGRMRVERLSGKGGLWPQLLEVCNNQRGCIKFSCFSGLGDRLPQTHACVSADTARLCFVSEIFGHPAYGQLAAACDVRIREQGPGDDAMGAFGFLLEAHKWRNLRLRFREFMPLGLRPLPIPAT